MSLSTVRLVTILLLGYKIMAALVLLVGVLFEGLQGALSYPIALDSLEPSSVPLTSMCNELCRNNDCKIHWNMSVKDTIGIQL